MNMSMRMIYVDIFTVENLANVMKQQMGLHERLKVLTDSQTNKT